MSLKKGVLRLGKLFKSTSSQRGMDAEANGPTYGAETVGTEFPNTVSLEPEATHAEDDSTVCLTCRSMLIRPTSDPVFQGMRSRPSTHFVIRQSVSQTSSSAMKGCVICTLAMAAQNTLRQHMMSINQLDGFELSLGWNEELDRFYKIRVVLLDHVDQSLNFSSFYNDIDLDVDYDHKDEPFNCANPITYPDNTGSELCLSIAKRWLLDCVSNHPKCREKSPAGWLPTRLIYIGPTGDPLPPRLIVTSEIKRRGDNRYVTLSHRWACSDVVKLQSSNIDSFRRCIPVESLSRTFLDAIKVARALEVRYLWIDSLCITQDSLADWQAESAQMADIYRNGVLNIAATGSSDNGGGLFQERPRPWVTPSKVHIQYRRHDKIYSAIPADLWGKWVSRSSLNRRGWVFQERMLSPRTLHFSSQLFWECRELMACETYPDRIPHEDNYYVNMEGTISPVSQKNWHEECKRTYFWTDVVRTYGRCSITKPDDRLIAISGIAQSLQPFLNDQYLAGLWKKELPYNLAWSLEDVDGQPQPPERYRCPSWSWAALDYTSASIEDLLVPPQLRVEQLVNVQEVYIEPLGPDSFGSLRGGYLCLTGRIGHIFPWDNSKLYGEWIDGHWAFDTVVDLDKLSVDDELLYCLPLLVRLKYKDSPKLAYCLLLKQLRPGAFEYTRVGLLKVSLELEDWLPQEIKWIVEYATSKTRSEGLVTVTIY